MTDTRPLCVKCETSMIAYRNGITVKYSHDSYQSGDVYKCPICDVEIVTGFGQKYYNWGYVKDDKTETMVLRNYTIKHHLERNLAERPSSWSQ